MEKKAWDITGELAVFLDEAAAHVPAEQRRVLQVLKIGEEFGEAAQAVIGATGTNPARAGPTRGGTWSRKCATYW